MSWIRSQENPQGCLEDESRGSRAIVTIAPGPRHSGHVSAQPDAICVSMHVAHCACLQGVAGDMESSRKAGRSEGQSPGAGGRCLQGRGLAGQAAAVRRMVCMGIGRCEKHRTAASPPSRLLAPDDLPRPIYAL